MQVTRILKSLSGMEKEVNVKLPVQGGDSSSETQVPGKRPGHSEAWHLVVPTASLPGPDECHAMCAEMGLEVQRTITALATDLTSQRASRSR